MTRKHGYRNIQQIKQKLYNKVLSRKDFPAFSAMFNAGVQSTLPTPLENIQIPEGINTDYGIAFAQIINQLLSGIHNFIVNFNAKRNAQLTNFQSPFYSIIPSNYNFIENWQKAYDYFVQNCYKLPVPARYDTTYFGQSVYNPAYTTLLYNNSCQQLLQYFSTVPPSNLTFDFTNFTGVSTYIPQVDNTLYNLISNTGIEDILNILAQQNNMNPLQYFISLPDFVKYALTILAFINNAIDNGIALDVSWFDRSSFSVSTENYQQLGNNVNVQYFANILGMILDFAPLDFVPLMPEFDENNITLDQQIAILSADKAIISIFGQIFLQHIYNPSPGGVHISQNGQIQFLEETYSQFLQIQQIVNRKYGNVWYAKTVASAIMEIARYYYTGNLSYNSGKRTLPYDQFLQQWKQKWSFYGLSQNDLQYAQQLGELLQGSGKFQAQQKLAYKKAFSQTWKPLFYYKNFKNVANRS